MRRIINSDRANRALAMFLAIIMVISIAPMPVFAATASVLTTDIASKSFTVGETTEFTYTTTANDDAGTMVKGSFEFENDEAIEKLEYLNSGDGEWYEFYGDFGPATGFPLTDATSHFRVTFKEAGEFSVLAYMKKVDDGTVLCSNTTEIVVKGKSTLTTDVDSKIFPIGIPTEFTFTTTANGHVGRMVVGTFEFSDDSAIDKLEYLNSGDGEWYEFYGDFGPATGFPMSDATSRFRVTFNKSGTYSLTASMKMVDGGEVLCSVTVPVNVVNKSVLTTDIGTKNFTVDRTTEFTYTTIPNDDAGKMVVGTFVFSDPDAIKKLEYLSSEDGEWYEFYGDFGPATGFPMTDATSSFRVTFNKAGTYTVTASMKEVGGEILSTAETEIVVLDKGTLSTDIGNKIIAVDRATEFTLSTIANGDTGTMVIGSVVFSDPDAIKKLEYLSSEDGEWYEFYGDYGPATGFSMIDGTSRFRVTFNKTGDYTVEAMMKAVDGGSVLCSTTASVTVSEQGVLTTDAGNKNYVVNEPMEFTFSTTANGDAGKMVLGSFVFAEPGIAKVEYLEKDGEWYELTGDYGPPTGFPMTDATSRFRITFNTAGTHFVSVQIKTVDGEVLCSANVEATVKIRENITAISQEVNLTMIEEGNVGDNISNSVTGATFSYSSNNSAVVEVDSNGKLIPNGVGSATITVTRSESGNYLGSVTSYVVNVELASQTIAFAGVDASGRAEMINGDSSFTSPTASPVGDKFGTGTITYSIVSDESGVVSGIDPATGALTFTYKIGEVVIKAVKAADTNYAETFTTYTLAVSDWNADVTGFYSLVHASDSIAASEDNWFKGDVSLKAVAGYLVSYSKDGVWAETLENVVTADGSANEVTFFVREQATGYISAGKTVTVQKDTVDPSAAITNSVIADWNDKISVVGSITEDTLEFTADALDELSGVKKIEYYVEYNATEVKDEAALDAVSAWETYNGTIVVNKDNRFVVYVKVTDNAGNYTYASTNVIIFDKTSEAEIKTEITSTAYENVTNADDVFYKGDVKIKVEITDALISSGLCNVRYEVHNGDTLTQSVDIFNYENTDPAYADLLYSFISDEGIIVDSSKNNSDNIKVTVYVTDNAGNENKIELSLKICTSAPSLNVTFENDPEIKGNVGGVTYYDSARTAKVVITGRTSVFNASNKPTVTVNATKGTSAEGNTYTLIDWVTEENVSDPDLAKHTLTILFNGSANYDFSIDYTDILGNEQNYTSEKFVVDNDTPTASISINGINTWTMLVETLSYGLWSKDAVKVTAAASDATSQIRSIEYYIGEADTVLAKAELEAITDWTPYSEFEIDKDQAFVVYLKVTDEAGRVVYISSDAYIVDMSKSAITITPAAANENGFYNSDFNVDIVVEDPAPSSGIKSVEYWVVSNGVETIRKTLYSFDYTQNDGENIGHLVIKELDETGEFITVRDEENVALTQNDLKNQFTATIEVDADANNSDFVSVFVKVVDNAGVEDIQSVQNLKVDVVAPKINVEFDDNNPETTDESTGRGYFKNDRVATVTFTERTSSFDEQKATESIVFTGKDSKDNEVNLENIKIVWTHSNSATDPDASTHTATVYFDIDANYEFTVNYTDRAGNACEYANVAFADGTAAPRYFTVDKVAPTGTLTVDATTWNKLLETLTFGLYKNQEVEVKATAADETSPIKALEYYISESLEPLTALELDAIKAEDWTEYADFNIPANKKFVVYIKIADMADHVTYLSSDAYIVDAEKSAITITPDDSDIKHNGINVYNKDAEVIITVKDLDETAYSGIKTVEYWVVKDGTEETQRATLYDFRYTRNEGENSNSGTLKIYENGELIVDKEGYAPTHDDLKHLFSTKVTVDAQKNDSCNVVLYVKVTDNAGNEQTNQLALDFDVTAPAISVEYDNNTAFKTDGDGRGYFASDRTATITIVERASHFNKVKAEGFITFSGTDAKKNSVDLSAVKIEWPEELNSAPNIHTAKIHFSVDANYTLSVGYEDLAGNMNSAVDAGASVTPYSFTVDRVAPIDYSLSVGNMTWNKLLDVLTFGIFSQTSYTAKVTASDDTSPLTIHYYKTDATKVEGDVIDQTYLMTKAELDGLSEDKWTEESEFQVPADYTPDDGDVPDEKFVIYVRVRDYAGNYVYLCSDGHVVDDTKSAIGITLPETTHFHINGEISVPIYNKDVDVAITVTDSAPYSGIKKVEYWVMNGATETQRATLYEFQYTGTGNGPKYEDLKSEFTTNIVIDSTKNNSCDVVLHVEVTDNAGNVTKETRAIDIDIVAPTIEVSYDNNRATKVVSDRGYFPASRTATVVITERAAHFDAGAATAGISIIPKSIAGYDSSTLISAWESQNGIGDQVKHKATIAYTRDANYTFAIGYTDLAGNTNNGVDTGASLTPYTFTVDMTAPSGTITISSFGTWDKLIGVLTFGLWSRDTVTVTASVSDQTSPIDGVYYYKTADTTAKTFSELSANNSWVPYQSFEVSPDEIFTVYLRIVDFAGNVAYVSSNGVILDDTSPVIEAITPQVTANPEQPVNGIYNTDVTVGVKVSDPKTGDTGAYAGIKEIRYEVLNMGEVTQQGVLYSFAETDPTHDKLMHEWSKDDAILVDKELNNSNDVVIKVYVTDNAGNTAEQSQSIKIDITEPKIAVSYDNNNGDTTFADGVYFKANRTATVVVTERNFNPALVKLEITNTDGYIPTISEWTTVEGSGNKDNTTHTAYVVFDRDGDYTFNISCSDNASNPGKEADYGVSLAPTAFTIDKTLPVINIVYDNNSVLNDNYYKAQRVATVTIAEHNFNSARVIVKLTATDNGTAIALPVMSGWTSNGDINTATILFDADARYTFDIDFTDKAGNAAANVDEQVFYVDKTAPKLTIEKIVDESANNDEGNIGFVITATDTNFDVFMPILTAVIKTEDSFETKRFELGEYTEITNGRVYTVTNIEIDGIYRITCSVVDKAGNAFSEVTLESLDGSKYVAERAGADTLVTFSVNREGSTFEIDEYTAKVIEGYYVKNIENDVVIVEINVDPLKKYAVTLNGKELVEGTDFTVVEEGGNGAWMKYTYSVNKDLFAAEGEYKVVVSSTDKADNDAFSDVKDATVAFVVDRTAPVVTVSGLSENGRYQTERQTVTLIPTDDGGMLHTLIVRLLDDNGEVISELVNLSGDDLITALENNGGMVEFEVEEGLYQNVQIICTDYASGGETEAANTYDVTFSNVSVSSNVFMIFWANKPLRWGTIGGVSAVAIGITVFFVLKNKKSKED